MRHATLAPPGPRFEHSPSTQRLGAARPAVGDAAQLHEVAARGLAGPGRSLPFLERIQASFGEHDLRDVRAHVDGPALRASHAIGAHAYALGHRIAFAGSPSLYVAAHEAAHVVQQRAGIQLEGRRGRASDVYERQADAVAERVVQGRSAAALLPRARGSTPAPQPALQALLNGTDFNNHPSQDFRYGLVHGTYTLMDNKADMHVDQSTVQNPFRIADVLSALRDVNQAMIANHARTQSPGVLDWRPTGAAIVKLVAELLGGSLGGGFGIAKAKLLQFKRKKLGNPPQQRDANVLSDDIIPEHMAFLGAMQGKAGVSIKAALPADNRRMQQWARDNPNPSDEQRNAIQQQIADDMETNMLADNDAGKARLAAYKASLEEGSPASLRVVLSHTHLPALIATLESLG